MAFGNDWLVSCDLWNLGEWRQALSPGRMFGGHLSDNFGVFLRKIGLFHGILFQIKKLPRVLVVFFVETPVLPSGGNEMPPLRISRFVVEPEEILMRLVCVFPLQVRDQIHSITMLGNRLARQRGDRGICLLYTSPSPRDRTRSRMPSSA